jgi:pimeloyl-ACP methyl ester carboxylesterase
MTSTPRDGWVDLEGLRFHYREWSGTGVPILLVHGLGSNCRFWDLVAPLLSRRFAVVALDQRGHGESAKPDNGYDFVTVAADLKGFSQALGADRPLLVGHSWGGNVALELAAPDPSTTRGLCLVDGGVIEVSAYPGMSLEEARKELAPPDLSSLTVDQLLERVRSHWPVRASTATRLEEFVLASFEVQDDGTIRPRLGRANHMKVVDALWRHRPSTIYSSVTCPVLLMPARQQGEQQPAGRRVGREESIARAESLLPVSKTVWLEDSVHDVPLQRPELVAQTIEDHILDGFFG